MRLNVAKNSLAYQRVRSPSKNYFGPCYYYVLPAMAAGMKGSNEGPPSLSVLGQLPDGTLQGPVILHVQNKIEYTEYIHLIGEDILNLAKFFCKSGCSEK